MRLVPAASLHSLTHTHTQKTTQEDFEDIVFETFVTGSLSKLSSLILDLVSCPDPRVLRNYWVILLCMYVVYPPNHANSICFPLHLAGIYIPPSFRFRFNTAWNLDVVPHGTELGSPEDTLILPNFCFFSSSSCSRQQFPDVSIRKLF